LVLSKFSDNKLLFNQLFILIKHCQYSFWTLKNQNL